MAQPVSITLGTSPGGDTLGTRSVEIARHPTGKLFQSAPESQNLKPKWAEIGPGNWQGQLCGHLCVGGPWVPSPPSLVPRAVRLCPLSWRPAGERARRSLSPGPARVAGYLP